MIAFLLEHRTEVEPVKASERLILARMIARDTGMPALNEIRTLVTSLMQRRILTRKSGYFALEVNKAKSFEL